MKNHKNIKNAIIFQNMSPKLPQGSLFHMFMLLGLPGDASMKILEKHSCKVHVISMKIVNSKKNLSQKEIMGGLGG